MNAQCDKLVTVVGSQFITLSLHLCVQHDGRNVERSAGLSARRQLRRVIYPSAFGAALDWDSIRISPRSLSLENSSSLAIVRLVCMSLYLAIVILMQYRLVTDKRKDGQTVAENWQVHSIYRVSKASLVKNRTYTQGDRLIVWIRTDFQADTFTDFRDYFYPRRRQSSEVGFSPPNVFFCTISQNRCNCTKTLHINVPQWVIETHLFWDEKVKGQGHES